MDEGIFVAEGEKVVRRLLKSPLEIVSFLLTREWCDLLSNEEENFRRFPAEVFVADKALLETIVGYRLHQGIMAVGKVPSPPELSVLVETFPRPLLLVALDGLMNSENVGVLIRNCAGFGVSAILVGENSSSPYLRRAVRNSMGTVFSLPVLHVGNLASALKELKKSGTVIIAAHSRGKLLINSTDLSGNSCIIFGNEESGISPAVLEVCDQQIAIPMRNLTDSLNVASASAVFLYEADRQRGL